MSNNSFLWAVVLICLLLFIEYGFTFRILVDKDEEMFNPYDGLVEKEKLLIHKEEKLVTALKEVNERDLKLNFVNRKLKHLEHLIRRYEKQFQETCAFDQDEDVSALQKILDLVDIDSIFNFTASVMEEKTNHEVEEIVLNQIDGELLDQNKNKYVLSELESDNPGSVIDLQLVTDLGVVLIASSVGGIIAAMFGQPILLGYLMGGSVIGPGGLKLIHQFVQVETLAQFGSMFLLFSTGVEFSYEKLRRVQSVALKGGSSLIISVVTLSVFILYIIFQRSFVESLFVGFTLSMSSTTVVLKTLMENHKLETTEGHVMTGLLIIQDFFLGAVLALLPVFDIREDETVRWKVTELFLSLVAFAITLIIIGISVPKFLTLLQEQPSSDLFLLGCVSFCIALTLLSEKLFASSEVGAFAAGILISSGPNANTGITKHTLEILEPIRDMFGVLFFSSIGMLVNPHFLLLNWSSVISLMIAVFVGKSMIGSFIVHNFGYSWDVSISVAVALAQVGEFAFVLAARGHKMKIIDDSLYHVVLGTTALGIIITPFVIQRHAKSRTPQEMTHKEIDEHENSVETMETHT